MQSTIALDVRSFDGGNELGVETGELRWGARRGIRLSFGSICMLATDNLHL